MQNIDLRTVDLNLLVALERLVARGSVSAAARDLGITQPAMSRTLQRLRDLLGDPLLVRVGRGVVATDRARALVEPVEEALRASRKVFEPADPFDPATAHGELALAVGDEAQMAFADAIVGAVWARAPGIDVRMRPLSPASADEARRGRVDLAIVPDLSPLPPSAGAVDLSEFVARPLYRRRWVVASSADHPRRRISLDAYGAASHVIVGWDGGGHGFVDDLLAPLGVRRRVAATVTSFHAAARLVAATDLLGTLPEEVVRTSEAGLVCCSPPFEVPEVAMHVLWHPRRTADPRHRFLRELVSKAVAERARPWARRRA